MEANIPLLVSVGNSLVMVGAIAFGAGKLKQSQTGVEKGLEKVYEKVDTLDSRVGDFQTRLSFLEGTRQGAQDERNRQGA